MVVETTDGELPLPSASEYWWISNAMLWPRVDHVGGEDLRVAGADPAIAAGRSPVPGTRISCVAPVARMAAIASFTGATHCAGVCTCGSFIRPKMTLDWPA